ncbi:MAG: CNNM domain-containing protein [bacterium]|nr:CNNM domain-containing protein [bacterium]
MIYFFTTILILLSALFSGLNLGLMSLSSFELKRKAELGDKNAKKVYEVRKNGNLLLVTLLLGNVAVNAAIAICFNSIMTGIVAGVITTMLITLFGEIAPQALFSRFALSLGARVVWVVKVFLFLFYPLAGPIAWLLNKIFGNELRTIYSKKELMQIISEHADDDSPEIRQDEERIALGALTFGDKKIREVMTPRSFVATVDPDDKINNTKINRLIKQGYSRYPVFDKDQDKVVGILYSYNGPIILYTF